MRLSTAQFTRSPQITRTIKQGPLHLLDGGGLARSAAPAWPVARPARRRVRPPGPVTRVIYRFPGSSHVPGVSPGRCPCPTVKAFLRLTPVAAQGVKGNNSGFFCCPQFGHSYPQLKAVIHRSVHRLFTRCPQIRLPRRGRPRPAVAGQGRRPGGTKSSAQL